MRTTIVALAIIALSWQAVAPVQAQPPRAPRLVQDGAAFVADDPPPLNRRHAAPIYLGWKWRPVGSGDALAPPSVIDDPPFGAAKSRLRPVYVAAWDPPQIILLWQAVLAQEVAPDQPFVRSLAPVLAAWQTMPPPRQRRPVAPIASVVVPADAPPFGLRTWRATVLASWQPPPPAPILRRVVVTASTSASSLAGSATATATGAGALTTSIRLAGAASGTGTGIGTLVPQMAGLIAGPLSFTHAGAGLITATRGGAAAITATHAGAGAITREG